MKHEIIFDGSTEIGTVIVRDGLIEARARFDTDEEARIFFALINEIKTSAVTNEMRIDKLVESVKNSIKSWQIY